MVLVVGKFLGADDRGRCDYTRKFKYLFWQYFQEIVGKGFIWHVKFCSGVLWEFGNTISSFVVTNGCTVLHDLVKRYRAEDGDLQKLKDILANHRAFPWFAHLSVDSDKPSHRMTALTMAKKWEKQYRLQDVVEVLEQEPKPEYFHTWRAKKDSLRPNMSRSRSHSRRRKSP